MTYAIGDQVEGYVLTDQGWVSRLELDTSSFRPGHVVNGAILTGALEWLPLRTAPAAPYQVGDVVDGYVLVPSGDWLPLAGQIRDRSGAVPAATAVPAEPSAKSRRTASVSTTRTQAQPQTRPRAEAQPRPQTHQRSAQPSRPQPQPMSAPAQPQVGQVVNGYLLTADRGWVPVSQVQRGQAPRPTAKNSDGLGRTMLVVLAVIAFLLLRSCA